MNMKKAFLCVGGSVMLAGCSSFYMKASPFYEGPDSDYTEPAEQRVNLWPLLYSRDPSLSVIWPLYTQGADRGYAWPLLTWWEQGDWTSLPLFTWKDGHDFVSLPLLTWKNKDGWTSLPLLSHHEESIKVPKNAKESAREDEYTFLLGLAGTTFNNDACVSSWCFPFYSYKEGRFHSLFYSQDSDDSWSIPLLLSHVRRQKHRNTYIALLLAGLSTTSDGYDGSYLFPLYVHDRNAFYTLPFGVSDTCWWITPLWIHLQDAELGLMGLCGISGDAWWATPAAIGTANGFYGAFGLFGWMEDGPTWCLPFYWADPKDDQYVSLLAGHVKGYDWWCTPLVSTYQNADGSGFWAWPLFGWNTDANRENVWWLGGIPLWTREKTPSGTSESFLWRLWHKETKGENVTIDCFPGITYDAHADGYEKTSFLWRCYRNETIPGKGRNLDVLFIPFSSVD